MQLALQSRSGIDTYESDVVLGLQLVTRKHVSLYSWISEAREREAKARVAVQRRQCSRIEMRRPSGGPEFLSDVCDQLGRQKHPRRYAIEDLQVYDLH